MAFRFRFQGVLPRTKSTLPTASQNEGKTLNPKLLNSRKLKQNNFTANDRKPHPKRNLKPCTPDPCISSRGRVVADTNDDGGAILGAHGPHSRSCVNT